MVLTTFLCGSRIGFCTESSSWSAFISNANIPLWALDGRTTSPTIKSGERVNFPSIEAILMFHQPCLAGHVSYMDESRMPKVSCAKASMTGQPQQMIQESAEVLADTDWHPLLELGRTGRQQRELALNIKKNCGRL